MSEKKRKMMLGPGKIAILAIGAGVAAQILRDLYISKTEADSNMFDRFDRGREIPSPKAGDRK